MKSSSKKKKDNIFHIGFEIALLLKALNAGFEIVCGVALMFLTPEKASHLIELLTRRELAQDPDDLIANALVHLSGGFTVSAQHFGIIYLLSHGILKLIIVWLLWRGKLWAYPLAIGILGLFVAYQAYKFVVAPSLLLVLLTILDLAVIALTIIEYRRQKSANHGIEP